MVSPKVRMIEEPIIIIIMVSSSKVVINAMPRLPRCIPSSSALDLIVLGVPNLAAVGAHARIQLSDNVITHLGNAAFGLDWLQ